ncbi:hypothetical protein ZWY2020_040416 [Hordeum vulgare]|nr:hypothetical protein ZWY2020_040416 [Hordeum vulgare]
MRGGLPPAKPRGTRGRGRGRAVAATPSEVEATRSPPQPQADSPKHRTSRVDSSEVEATRSPVHEPQVDEPQVDEPSTHETRVREASFQATPEQTRDEVFVTLPGREREVGMTWEHYLGAPAPPEVEIDGVLCDTRADMVIRRFWTYYRCEEGYEEDVAKVIETECRRLLQNFRHEARVQVVRDYYATRRIRIDKEKCRDAKMEKENYMKVPPRWCVDKMDCWEALMDQWCSETWQVIHNNGNEEDKKKEKDLLLLLLLPPSSSFSFSFFFSSSSSLPSPPPPLPPPPPPSSFTSSSLSLLLRSLDSSKKD